MKKVVHFEIPADDLERAKKFYSIFGWQMQDWPMPDGSVYVGARTVETAGITYQPKESGASTEVLCCLTNTKQHSLLPLMFLRWTSILKR